MTENFDEETPRKSTYRIALTPESKRRQADKAILDNVKATLEFGEVPVIIIDRVLKCAERDGVTLIDRRDGRVKPGPVWTTRTGLRGLAKAAETVAGHIRRDNDDAVDADAFRLLCLARKWRRWARSA